jgi:hypothetical protein
VIPDRPRWARLRWLWLYAALASLAASACFLYGQQAAGWLLLATAATAYAWGWHR